jgi:hypothetical protein
VVTERRQLALKAQPWPGSAAWRSTCMDYQLVVVSEHYGGIWALAWPLAHLCYKHLLSSNCVPDPIPG